MITHINSEYHFTRKINDNKTITLICYIDYVNKTYDIMQPHQEGLMFKDNNKEVDTNLTYLELAKEALEFVNNKLYIDDL